MKKLIFIFMMAILTSLTLAQNTDKNTFNQNTDNILNRVFEKTLEVLRTTITNDSLFTYYNNSVTWTSVTISAATSITGIIDLGVNTKLIALEITSTWDAADITFQASSDGVNFRDYYDSGGEIVYSAGTGNRIMAITPKDFAGIRYIKFRSGTTGTPVNQTANEILKYAIRIY